jgi:hypothetical protein
MAFARSGCSLVRPSPLEYEAGGLVDPGRSYCFNLIILGCSPISVNIFHLIKGKTSLAKKLVFVGVEELMGF